MPLFENVPCPNCSRSLRLPTDVIGSPVRCPLCQTTFLAARDGAGILTIPETGPVPPAPPPRPVPSLSLDEGDLPTAPLADDPPLAPLLDDVPLAPLAATDDVEVLDHGTAPPAKRRRTPAGKAFAPVAFVAFVQRDPDEQLEGRFQAEVDVKGLHLWRGKGRVITVERGAAAKHHGGARMSVQIQGRTVDLTLIRGEGGADELARQVVAFLKGDRDDVVLPGRSALPLVPLLVLPLGIPVLAGLFGQAIGGAMGTALWGLFAAALVGTGCALAFGMRGGLMLRGALTAVVVGFGYFALFVGFAIDWMVKPRIGPGPGGNPVVNWAWRGHPRPDQGFSVDFPGFPALINQGHPAFKPGAMWKYDLWVPQPQARFQVIFGELNPQPGGAGPDVNAVMATVIPLAGMTVDRRQLGRPDRCEYRIVGPNPGRARLYVSPTRAVLLVATSSQLGPDHPDVLRFLNSFRFTGADWGGEGPMPGPGPKPVDPTHLAPGGRLAAAGPSYVWAGLLADNVAVALKDDGTHLTLADGGRVLAERRADFPQQAVTGATAPGRPEFALVGHSGVAYFADNAGKGLRPFKSGAGWSQFACALSPDGATLAIGDGVAKVHLWDVRAGKVTRTLDAAGGQVLSLAFSPDGKWLAAGNENRQVRVLPLDGGEARAMERPHGAARAAGDAGGFAYNVRAVCFAADGRVLASAGNDRAARVWDALTGKQLHEFLHPDAVTAAAFLPGGRLLFTGCADGRVRVYDVTNGAHRGTIRETVDAARRTGVVRSLAVSADGRQLVAATPLGVERWDLSRVLPLNFNDRRPPAPLPAPATPGKLPAKLSRLMGGGGNLLALLADGQVRRLQTPSLDDSGTVARVFGQVTAGLSADGRTVAISAGAEVQVYDTKMARLKAQFFNRTPVTSPVALSGDGNRIVALTAEGTGKVVVFDVNPRKEQRFDHPIPSPVGLAVSPDGRVAAVISRASPRVHLFDLTAGRETLRMRGHDKGILDVAYSPDGKTLATLGLDGSARLWDVASGRERFNLAGHTPGDGPGHVAFSPDGRTLVVGAGPAVRYWDTGSGRLLNTDPAASPVRGVAADAGHVYIGSEEGRVRSMSLTAPAFLARPAPVTPDLSKSPPPEVPDLQPGSVEPHLALVADPGSGVALAFTRDRLMLRLSYPGLQVQEAYWTGKVIYRAALDARRGLLFAAVADVASLKPGGDETASAAGPLAVYDVKPLFDRKPLPARLVPKGDLAADGRFTDLLAGERLCYRVVKGGKVSVGHADPATLRVGVPLELPLDQIGPVALTPDGKALIVGGTDPTVGKRDQGRVVRVDLATLKVGEPVPTGAPPVTMAASADWVAVQTRFAGGRPPLVFLGHDGKELARWATDRWPFAAAGRLYLSPDRSPLQPAAYEVGAKPPAAMPTEPASRVTSAGKGPVEQAAVIGGRLLVSPAGDLYALGGEPMPPPAAPPGDAPGTGARTLPALLSGPERVTALVAASDRELLAGRSGGAVQTWIPAEGRVIQTAQAGAAVFGLARSPTWYAAASPGWSRAGTAKWQLLGPVLPDSWSLPGPTLAFLPGGETLIGATPKGLNVWKPDLRKGTTERSVAVPSPVTAVATSGAGDVACGAVDGLVRLFAAKTYEKKHELKGHDGEVRAVLLSGDGKRAYSAGVDGKVIIWDAQAGKPLRVLDAHDHVVTCLALSPDGKLLVSGALDGSVRGWEADSGKLTKRLTGLPSEPVAGLAFVSGGAELAAAAGSRVRRWDLGPGKGPAVGPPPAGAGVDGSAVRMLPFRAAVIDARAGYGFFVTSSSLTGLRRFSASDFRPAGSFSIEQPTFALLLDRTGKKLYGFKSATGVSPTEYPPRGTDVEMQTFDVTALTGTGTSRRRVEPAARTKLGGAVLCPLLSPDGTTLFYLDPAGKRLVRRNVAGGGLGAAKLDHPPTHLSLSPDGKRLFVATAEASNKGRVAAYDPATLAEKAAMSVGAEVLDLAAADGDRVMVAAAGKATLLTMKGATEREWSTPDRPYVGVAADGTAGFVVPGRAVPFNVQVWPLEGGPARTFEVRRTGLATYGGGFTVSDDGTVLLIGRSGLAVRVPGR